VGRRRGASLRQRVRGERGAGDCDGADDGQSEAVVVVDAAAVQSLDALEEAVDLLEADLGLIRVVVIDACGAGDPVAAQRSLDSLAVAGDAILTEVTTITGLLARPTTGEPGPKGAAPGLAA
jgi:hypothetical protein